MVALESKVDGFVQTFAEINANLKSLTENMASKAYVLRWFGITAAILIVMLPGHILLRVSLPPG